MRVVTPVNLNINQFEHMTSKMHFKDGAEDTDITYCGVPLAECTYVAHCTTHQCALQYSGACLECIQRLYVGEATQ